MHRFWRALPPEAGGLQRSGDAKTLRGLTFDMSGGPKGAKRPLERPLDGGVRRRAHDSSASGNCKELQAIAVWV